jgi:hypothetical protein
MDSFMYRRNNLFIICIMLLITTQKAGKNNGKHEKKN